MSDVCVSVWQNSLTQHMSMLRFILALNFIMLTTTDKNSELDHMFQTRLVHSKLGQFSKRMNNPAERRKQVRGPNRFW